MKNICPLYVVCQVLKVFLIIMLIALAKSWSVSGASHQPAFMSSCLTVRHTCLPCLPSEKMLLFWSDIFVIWRVVSWERWVSSELGRWERAEGSELGRWERCVTVVRWQSGKGGRIVRWKSSEVARWEGWYSSEVVTWEVPIFIQEWGTQGESKISSFCF